MTDIIANILAWLAALEQAVGVAQPARIDDRPRRRLPTVAVAQRYSVVPRNTAGARLLRLAAPVGISPGAAPLKIFSPKPPGEFFPIGSSVLLAPRWRGRCACERDETMPRKIEEAEPAAACPMSDIAPSRPAPAPA